MNIFRVIVIVSVLHTGLGWTQSAVTATGSPATQSQQLPIASQLPDSPGSNTPAKRKHQRTEGEQTNRMFWLIPNFGAVNANTQLPPLSAQERGLSQTARNWGTQMESAILNHVFKEFWPDIRRKVFRRK